MLIDRLENSGYRVDLTFSRTVANGYKEWVMECSIKRESDPLDMDLLAFVLANPAMMRRICFAVVESPEAE